MTPFHTLPAALSPDECDRLVTLCQSARMSDAGLVGAAIAPDIRRADLVWLDDLPETAWVIERLIRLVARVNREAYRFDLDDFAESAQVARYGADRQGHFDWHADIGRGPLAARRKLTGVVQLSDPASYRGGALELRPDSQVAQAAPTQGTATIFPSFVLHRVTPVTIGTRWSLTLWAHGPAFR